MNPLPEIQTGYRTCHGYPEIFGSEGPFDNLLNVLKGEKIEFNSK